MEEIKCPKCEGKMTSIQACHMFCTKCGPILIAQIREIIGKI
ncbi:MAG: hypothetical protein ACT4OW_06090 [Nitrososphaerota archaeon]